MKQSTRSCITQMLCLVLICATVFPTAAQTFNFKTRESSRKHSADDIIQHNGFNDTLTVAHDRWDELVASGTSWGSYLKYKNVQSYVSFSVNHRYPKKVFTPYVLKLTYKVYGYGNPAQPNTMSGPVYDTLTIAYKPDSLASFQDRQVKKYNGFHKVMVVLTGLYKIDGAGGAPVAQNLGLYSGFQLTNFDVEASVVVTPYDKKVPYMGAYKDAYGDNALLSVTRLTPQQDYLPVLWKLNGMALDNTTLQLNPVKYELEWTYVDDYKVNTADGSVDVIPPANLNYSFTDNATRIWLDTNYYRIPTSYQRGHLIYRVRLVRPDSNEYRYPIYGPWTTTYNTGLVSNIASGSRYQISVPHLSDSLNWQYTVSFAEQGKYKQVMSYYDGMLKNRQSITRFNSRPDQLLATEQIYDYEGRPSISILPTPVSVSAFRFQQNLAVNSMTNMPYRAADFDKLQLATCPDEIKVPPLAHQSLADIYYSSNNPDKDGFQKFVPDAGGYPFVQTIYSPGYDERVEKQGGAGDTLQIGYGHTVKNDYTATEQTDLNRLFGTDIGWAGYYRKTVSRDPNGQLSINVTDYKGKTMMSSMVGLPDTQKHALVSNENLAGTTQFTEDFLAGTTQQTIGMHRILDKTFYNEAAGNNTAQYLLSITPYPVSFCPGKYLSVGAQYYYSIVDECGTIKRQDASLMGSTGVTTSGAPVSLSTTPATFFMEMGKHSLHKDLSVRTSDIMAAVDVFMALPAGGNCLHTEPWFIKQSVLSKQFPCPQDLSGYDCPTCGSKRYEMIQELWPNQDSANLRRKYGVYKVINGAIVGNNNSDFTIFCGHGMDPNQWTTIWTPEQITPLLGGGEGTPYPGGFNIYTWPDMVPGSNAIGMPPGNPYLVLNGNDTLRCRYRYQDPCVVTMPESVTRNSQTYTHLQQLPVTDFISIFNDSIAMALLPMHPEYCDLLACLDDVYKKRINKIPGAGIAQQLGLLRLKDLILADPVYAVMLAHPAQFPHPFDSLAWSAGHIICLDSIALNDAYCRSSDGNMLQGCQAYIFHDEIAAGELANEYVSERYFQSIKDFYFANRKRYLYLLSPAYSSGSFNCNLCSPVRMRLVPEPVFPQSDAIYANLLNDFNGSMSTASPAGATSSSQAALNQYFQLSNGVNLDTLQGYADSAVNTYTATSNTLMQAVLDSMMAQFANCTPVGNLSTVRAYLLNLYQTGAVSYLRFTPAQVRAALKAGNINMDDLCNPYIVNYDNFSDYSQESNTGMQCISQYLQDDMSRFLNWSGSNILLALQHPGTTYNAQLWFYPNEFAQNLSNMFYGVSNCDLVASYNATDHLYTLTFSAGPLPSEKAKFFIKADIAANACQFPFAAAPGETLTLKAYCTKEAFGAFPAGLIGVNTFALGVQHSSAGGNLYECKMKGWSDKYEFNSVQNNPISNTVSMPQMKGLYKQFWDTLTVYQVKGANHPYYGTMLRNFMNDRLGKSYTEGQYLDFIESCALSDSMLIPTYCPYFIKTFANSAATISFINAVNSFDPDINGTPLYGVNYGTYEVGYNFEGIPKNKLRVYANFILSYPSVFTAYNYATRALFPGKIFAGMLQTDPTSGFVPSSVTPLMMQTDPVSSVWNGTSFVPANNIHMLMPSATDYVNSARNLKSLKNYIFSNGVNARILDGIEAGINEDYYKPEKQAFLRYAYGLQNLGADEILTSLQPYILSNYVPGVLNGKLISYGHPARPDNIQNLYVGNPATMTNGTQYAKMQQVLTQVSNYFNSLYGNTNSNILFSGANTRQIPQPSGKMLTAYRCQDTAFWFRYFDQGDTLYNMFVAVPGYIDTSWYRTYRLSSYGPNLGEGNSRSFWLQFESPTAPIRSFRVNGFTDFTVAKNEVLHDVVLAHSVLEDIPDIDTLNNCERQLLNAAIYEGKVRYRQYIDETRTKLYNDFYAYLMGNALNEQLNISYRNQRFNYTLYNYDRAGNLVRTVPPAGVNPLTSTAGVDANRSYNPTGSQVPFHDKPSDYEYNSLNQVVHQHTPDGGDVDLFYDAAGRVLFSQNDKQRPLGDMTYTLYDNQGRIVETGESRLACPYFTPGPDMMSCSNYDPVRHEYTPYPELIFDLKNKTNDQVVAFVRAYDRHEVVLTVYDTACLNVSNKPGYAPQENLRKRVATIKYYDVIPPNETNYANYKYATHFSYDIAGNVKTLTRDYPSYRLIGQDLKRVDYDYDVISGKVNLLSYNRGFADQYFQHYAYDDDNRITEVNTSSDGVIWQRDAGYQYYQHGPLARMELGELNVQGVDYAYTIQGWLKAVNGDLLVRDREMGLDGFATTVSTHSAFARDAAALSLDYFKGDYKPIGSTPVTYADASGKNLYNGNIPRATTSILPFPDLRSKYTYDQLNRIIRSDYANLNRATAQLTNTADYYSSYAYDPDGNLKKLVRKGNNAANPVMDSLLYHYAGYLNYSTGNNRLLNVTDYANNTYSNDIKKFTTVAANRYTYDATGNVTQDLVSGQDNIDWNHYNKVKDVYNSGQNQYMYFEYDGTGQRYLKGLGAGVNGDQAGAATMDYYVRDAQGNILAVYKDETEYKMTRQQWTEYITSQIMKRCDPWYSIVLLQPYYFDRSFTNNLFTAFNQSGYFMYQMSQLPASYLLQSPQIATSFMGVNYLDPSMFAAMGAFTVRTGTNIAGTALNNMLTEEEPRTQFMEALCTISAQAASADMSNTYLGLLCANAPNVMQLVMKDFGMTTPFSSDCNVNAFNLLQFAQDKGYAFSTLVESIRGSGDTYYPDEYQKFLQAVYAEDRVFTDPATGRSGTFLTLLYEMAPGVLPAALKYLGLPAYGSEYDIWTATSFIAHAPYDISRFNVHVNFGSSVNYEAYEQFGNVLLQPAGVTTIDWNLWEHLGKYMPNTSAQLAYSLGMEKSTAPEAAPVFLAQYLQQQPVSPVIHKMAAYVTNNLGSLDGEESFANFVYDLGGNESSLASLTQANKSVSGLIPILNRALDNPMQFDGFAPFVDEWSGARPQLDRILSGDQLLEAVYRMDPANTINSYINLTGDWSVFAQSLGTIGWLTPDRFVTDMYIQPRYCLVTDTIGTIVHDAYKQVLSSRRFSLAEHDLYGSSRLGLKTYLPGQFYKYYDYTGPTLVTDTATMSARPWYSLEHNGLIAGMALEPYNNADRSNYYLMHTIGLKQYEVSNHLGNVQATVTDLPYPETTDNIILGYNPALSAAYDYYPFGMLMPGRFVSDESLKCMTQTQTKWVTNWVDSCYDTYSYTTIPNLRAVGGSFLTISDDNLLWDLSKVSSTISFDVRAVPNLTNSLSLNVTDVSGGYGQISIVESIAGREFIRASQSITKPSNIILNFVSTSDLVEARISGPTKIKTGTVCVKRPQQSQQTMLVDICNSAKDRYRFGFNGKEKVNEWTGIGNFEDYGFRNEDTRIARFISVDPLTKKYPKLTPYQFASNRPIISIDVDGLEAEEDLDEGDAAREEFENNVRLYNQRMAEVEAREREEQEEREIEHQRKLKDPFSGEKETIVDRLRRAAPQIQKVKDEDVYEQSNDFGARMRKIEENRRDLNAARARGVRRAWAKERELVRVTGRGTREWNDDEKEELLETGKVKNYIGHHINSVNAHPEMADDPDNIEFVTAPEHNIRHRGGTRIPTTGPKIDRDVPQRIKSGGGSTNMGGNR